MDPSDLPSGKPSPRRELQGPRPTPLKIRKDSHKIKKPPIAPQLPHHQQQQQQKSSQPPAHQHRPPVIIYTVSPKVIHTDANDFMKLVQRLTGPSSSSLSSPSYSSSSSLLAPSFSSVDFSSGAISPAARFASIERTNINNNNSSQGGVKLLRRDDSINSMEGLEMGPTVDRTGSTFPSILSPMPSSLPPISPNFFSPTIDPNSLSFLHDLSPIFHGNKNYLEGNFIMPSPSTFFSAPITSPTPSFDLFNQFLDL